jgi:hypothetical protein
MDSSVHKPSVEKYDAITNDGVRRSANERVRLWFVWEKVG